MDREQTLDFLLKKRSETAEVATAQYELQDAENKFSNGKKKLHKTIIMFWIITVFNYFFTGDSSDLMYNNSILYYDNASRQVALGHLGAILLPAIIAGLLMLFKYRHYLMPAQNEINKAKHHLQSAEDNPIYQNGSKGFPTKFYNYSDAYRLWKLIDENRANTLQDAFNLLETQHFYEDQISIQEEIRSLQQDIAANAEAAARSASIAASSSTINAINSFK